ncbi:MAG: hypothetical protein HYW45_01900 [Candidatus Daviesbacteria bacterium]|nr:MAG: hypothetical protein HYW45_01900 [Candidatus Daviesbacteria bacterium]
MTKTQNSLTVQDINSDLLLLKDGGATLVLKVGAVNFGLLSQKEQLAIVDSFAQLLNSLSFPIQIIIQSIKLDISSYLTLLDSAQKLQNNPLLSAMMTRYRNFIQQTIKENEVLDKNFYIAINVSSLELGLSLKPNSLSQLPKIKAIILPRRDQIIRQLSRAGIKAEQLKNAQLVKLFFNIYNQTISTKIVTPVQVPPVKLAAPQVAATPFPTQPKPTPIPITPTSNFFPNLARAKTHPFVVEELGDNI